MSDRLKIVYKPISEIKEYANNPRKNEYAVEAVKNSVSAFGFRVPIIIDSNDIIVAGHTRVKACYELGITEVPCIIADDLTEEQIRAFRLVDNKTSELSGWDFAKLDTELGDILNIDMSEFGFKEIDMAEVDSFFDNPGTALGDDSSTAKPRTEKCPFCGEEFEI